MSLLDSKLKAVLRKQLSEKHITQKQLATELGVSLATVKRWLARGDMPFSAVVSIAELVQLSLRDLEKLLERGEIHRQGLSPKQEKFIASHSRAAFIFLLIFIGFDRAEILRQTQIGKKEYEGLLRQLAAADLLYINDRGMPVPLARGPFRWKKGGPFNQAYAKKVQRELLAQIEAQSPSIGAADEELSLPYLRTFEMYLTKKNAIALTIELSRLIETFHERSRIDRESVNPLELRPVSALLSVSHFNLWKAVMWDRI